MTSRIAKRRLNPLEPGLGEPSPKRAAARAKRQTPKATAHTRSGSPPAPAAILSFTFDLRRSLPDGSSGTQSVPGSGATPATMLPTRQQADQNSTGKGPKRSGKVSVYIQSAIFVH